MANSFPKGNYGPYGYNDNNSNRRRVPSNRYPPRRGLSGSGFGNFQPVSDHQLQRMKNPTPTSNFNQAYTPNKPLIERMDYKNYGQLLYNNVDKNVMDEHIVEYRVNIDSFDRDINAYPNQFDFKVQFDAPATGILRTEVIKHGKLVPINQKFYGPPRPHIHRKFRNVKYVKLDSIILPQFGTVIKNKDTPQCIQPPLECQYNPGPPLPPPEYILDRNPLTANYNLVNDRFVMMVVNELECNRVYCTYDGDTRYDPIAKKKYVAPCPFAHILPKDVYGIWYYSGEPYYGSKIYINSQLGNISSMTIKFYNSFGRPLKYTNQWTPAEIDKAEKECKPLPLYDVRHPLNYKTQVHISFVIGVVESQINTDTKFVQA